VKWFKLALIVTRKLAAPSSINLISALEAKKGKRNSSGTLCQNSMNSDR